jgi:hypothetical protein
MPSQLTVANISVFLFFLTIKPTRCTNYSNLFWNETPHVSDSSSVHNQEFSLYKQQWYKSYRLPDSLRACMTFTIAVCTVKKS